MEQDARFNRFNLEGACCSQKRHRYAWLHDAITPRLINHINTATICADTNHSLAREPRQFHAPQQSIQKKGKELTII
jgi:hypothetical protein